MPETSIAVRNLNHYFLLKGGERSKVLDENNLTLHRGEIVIMMGRAGAGKTTLLTLIGALRRVQEGRVEVLGQELSRLSDRQIVAVRRKIGFIFQRHNLFESLTGLQNVALAMETGQSAATREFREALRRWDREIGDFFRGHLADLEEGRGHGAEPLRGKKAEAKRAELRAFVADRERISTLLNSDGRDDLPRSLLVLLGLEERTGHKPNALSGGQRQRVAIARALANLPELILADEPTASLDEENGRVVAMLLQRLAKEGGCTIMLVTHDPQILDIADRIVTMEKGRIIADIDVVQSTRICEFLSHCASFEKLTPLELREVADKIICEAYPDGATVIKQGEPGDKFYLIKSGRVDVYIDGETPDRRVKNLGQGDFFGERALIDQPFRTATVKAVGDVELYALGKGDFHEALAASPSFAEQIRRVYHTLKTS